MAVLGDEGRRDLSRGYLPVVIVFAIIVAVASAAYQIGSIITGIQVDRISTAQKFDALEKQIAEIKRLITTNAGCAPSGK